MSVSGKPRRIAVEPIRADYLADEDKYLIVLETAVKDDILSQDGMKDRNRFVSDNQFALAYKQEENWVEASAYFMDAYRRHFVIATSRAHLGI